MGAFITALGEQAAGAASSVVGAGLGMAMAGWQDRRQLRQQEKLQNLQMQGQKQMMNYQQQQALDYWKATGPVGQMAQLKDAGLNAGLIYGMGGGAGGQTMGPTANVGGGQAAGASGEGLAGMGLMLQARMTEAQIELAKSQTNKNNAEADKTKGVDTAKAWTEIENLVMNTANTRAQKVLTGVITDLKALELNVASKTFDDAVSLIESEAEEARQDVISQKRANRIGDATEEQMIKQINFGMAMMMANKALTEAQTRLANANVGLTNQQTKLAEANTRKTEAEITDILRQAEQRWQQLEINARHATVAEKQAGIASAAQQLAQDLAVPEMIGKAIFGMLIGQKLGTAGSNEIKGFRR